MNNFIDYSQWKSWKFCPAEWYEKYVNKRIPRWGEKQRDDALALGSLVHAGLQKWEEEGVMEIPPSVIEEVTPTAECLQLANWLVYGKVKRFPTFPFSISKCEAPLRFPLLPEIDGLAKVDNYFYAPTDTQLESGQEGEYITVSKGWWVQEYKTKGASIPLDMFIKKWQVNMQVNFQMLALQAYISSQQLKEKEYHDMLPPLDYKVQGVLITVVEKPNLYIPKRTCKGCKGIYEFTSWIPCGELWACPICGNKQKLDIPKKPEQPNVECYRVVAQRSVEQLRVAKGQIIEVAKEMERVRKEGMRMDKLAWNTENCVEAFGKRTCGYFRPHTYGGDTREDEMGFENARDYVGEKENER